MNFLKKLQVSISPATFLLVISMIATMPLPRLCACFLAAGIHELGHIAAAKLLGIDISYMKLDVLGARLYTSGKLCSYTALALLCLAGPFVNLLSFALLVPLSHSCVWIEELALSSLSLCLLNLLPVQGFDGGRTVHAILSSFVGFELCERICTLLGFFSLFLMWLLSVWLLLRTGTSLTLFVFSCCLFGMLFV